MSAEGGKDVKGVPNNKLRSDGRHTFTPVAIADKMERQPSQDQETPMHQIRELTLVDILVQSMNQRLSLMVVQRETGGHLLSMMKKIEVSTRSLDSFCAEHDIDHIDFLWMDVQGAEKSVFAGASEMKVRLIISTLSIMKRGDVCWSNKPSNH